MELRDFAAQLFFGGEVIPESRRTLMDYMIEHQEELRNLLTGSLLPRLLEAPSLRVAAQNFRSVFEFDHFERAVRFYDIWQVIMGLDEGRGEDTIFTSSHEHIAEFLYIWREGVRQVKEILLQRIQEEFAGLRIPDFETIGIFYQEFGSAEVRREIQSRFEEWAREFISVVRRKP